MHALSTGRPDGAHDTRVTSASEDNEDAPQLQARGVGCYVMGGGKRGEEAACVGELTVGAGVVMDHAVLRRCRAEVGSNALTQRYTSESVFKSRIFVTEVIIDQYFVARRGSRSRAAVSCVP